MPKCRPNVRSSNTVIIISDDDCWRVSTSDGSRPIRIQICCELVSCPKVAISPGASLGLQPSFEMETYQKKSSEVIVPLLEHGKLHFGSGRDSELNNMIKIAINPGASLEP